MIAIDNEYYAYRISLGLPYLINLMDNILMFTLFDSWSEYQY